MSFPGSNLPAPDPQGPHLQEKDLLALVQDPRTPAVDPVLRAHLSQCDTCLLRFSQVCDQISPEGGTAASLRAVNLAASRFQEEFAQAAVAGGTKDSPGDTAWRAGALLGKCALAGAAEAAPSTGIHSPLLAFFLGKRQTSK